MATPATPDLRTLYDTVLAPRIAALEGDRLRVKGAVVSSALLIGLPLFTAFCGGGDLIALALPEHARFWVFPVAIVCVVGGVGVAFSRYALPGLTAYLNYRARFKREVVAEIFRAVCPTAVYSPHAFISPKIFEQSGLFTATGEPSGDDLVRGRIGDTPFEACEMGRHDPQRSDNSPPVFHGLFFHIDFNKTIHGRTVVQPQAGALSYASRADLTRVPLENPDFESRFEVYSSNPVEARYILTPLLMERIVEIDQKMKRPVCLSFVDNRAFVAVHYERQLFEPSIAATTSYEAVADMADLFRLAELVVRELDLNTRIWTKDVDPHLLDQAPVAEPLAALDTGNVTVAQMLKTATGFVDADTGETPVRPAHSRAHVERYSDIAIVHYRIAWWAWMCLAMSTWFALAGLGALAFLVAPQWAVETLTPTFGLAADFAEAMVGLAPMVIGVSVVVGGFITLYWITYVRRVVIERETIRVKRGLSPFSHFYPRSAQTRILQLDKFLYLGQADRVKVINPSLSPMLKSNEEARWVAWEMRQALNEIASSPGSAPPPTS